MQLTPSSSIAAESAPASGGVRHVVLALFFVTGLSSLIYQVLWLRMLATVFGSTTYATATVLAAFMGGLALGSYLFGRVADRLTRHLVVYGLLELGVGVFGLLFPFILHGYEGLHVHLQRITSWSFYAYSLVRFVACSAILVIPTTLMGGTFPVVSRFYVRRFSRFTENVSLLYGINTAGAVAGVVLAGFVLIPAVGLFHTSLVAVAGNAIAGGIAILVQRRTTPAAVARESRTPTTTAAGEAADIPDAFRLRTIIAAAFLSGVAGLAYEVIWTRTLVFILDSFVYSFSIMLATFLTGLALGSLILSIVARWIRRKQVVLAVLFVAIGLAALATYPFFAKLTDWKVSYLNSLSSQVTLETPAPWMDYILFKFGIASLIMIVPTLLMGAAFPLLLRLYTSSIDQMGRKIGAVYASNTLGAIAGSFAAGFVLIPFLGSRNALIAASAVSVLTGVILLAVRAARVRRRDLAWAAVPVAVFVAAVLALPTNVYQRIFQKAQSTFRLVYYDEDPTATVTAHKRGKHVIININGLNVAGTSFNFLTTQKMQAHLALLLHPDPKNILQIGFGSGGTAYSVSRHVSVQRIDCVELCRGVIQAAKHFLPSNHGVLADPRVHLTIDDARNYILVTPRKYDVILSDSIHPTYAGNGTLYSKDYFALCKKRLEPGGFVSFWLPTYLLSTNNYKTIIRTFQSEFPYVMVWYVNNAIEAYTIVIGRMKPIHIDVDRIRRKLAEPAVAKDLAEIDVTDPMDILSYFVMGPKTVARFVDDAALNTDDNPVIEFRAPRSMSRRRTWYSNMRALVEMREPPLPYLTHVGRTEEETAAFVAKFKRVYSGVSVMLQGQLLDIISYEFEKELAYYRKAETIDPDSQAIRRLIALTTARVLAVRGERLLRAGKRDEAMARFQQAIETDIDPYDDTVGHAWYRIAEIDRSHGDFRGATDALARSLEILPCNRGALLLRGTLALERGDMAAARDALARLRELYPDDNDVAALENAAGARVHEGTTPPRDQ